MCLSKDLRANLPPDFSTPLIKSLNYITKDVTSFGKVLYLAVKHFLTGRNLNLIKGVWLLGPELTAFAF